MYPKESKQQQKLFYSCRNCGFETQARNPRVYETNVTKTATTQFSATERNPDLTKDPTLPRMPGETCPECGHEEVVYMSPSEEAMTLVFICCECQHSWDKAGDDEDVEEET